MEIVLYFSSEEDLENLLDTEGELCQAHLSLNYPRGFLAARSVFISLTSYWIGDKGLRDVLADVEEENQNMSVFSGVFLGRTDDKRPTMKLTFTTIAATTQATTQGFNCFGIKIPPY